MKMAAAISAEEYLRASFEGPDRELLNGEVQERGMPTYQHGKLQGTLFHCFVELGKSRPLYPCVELRLPVAPDRYRVADVAVFAGQEPAEPVPSYPPAVVVEVISPDDRWTDVLAKLKEFADWGVRQVWLVDSIAGAMYTYEAGGLKQVQEFSAPDYGVTISSEELFAKTR